jgi:queuine tRNA-ribosyltransferase
MAYAPKFEEASRKYRPASVRLLFIAEAPPQYEFERFFYFEHVHKADTLFLEMMKVLYPAVIGYEEERKSQFEAKVVRQRKAELLEKFKQDGFYLIDASENPMPEGASTSQKERIIRGRLPELMKKVQQLCGSRGVPIILISGPTFSVCAEALRVDGQCILNEEMIDTPAQGGQKNFRRKLDEVFSKLRLGQSEPEFSLSGSKSHPGQSHFHIQKALDGARRAALHLPHQTVHTPVFMPVGTQATVKAIPQHLLEELGAQIILGNTYHLYLRPGHELIRGQGGLHRFMSWPRALLTDSGGFQVFSLGDLRKVIDDGVQFRSHLDGSAHFFSPEHSIDVQIALGADIIMAFDECTEYPADEVRARRSLELTLSWARRCKDHFEAHRQERPWPEEFAGQTQSLFGIVQGGVFPSLRREAAERLVEMDFSGYAIGGLSVGEPRTLTREMIEATLPYLPADKPRYVMGVGYPDEIVEYAAMGVDMMDCVLPTRAARHGLLFTSEGRLNIKNRRFAEDQGPLDPGCRCLVCARYSRAYLRHLFVTQEVLGAVLNTVHNLAYYLDTMRAVRDAIELGTLPVLLAAVRDNKVDGTIREE